MSKKQKNYPVTKSEEWLFSILDGAKLAAAPVTIRLSSSAVSCLIGIGKDHTAEILIDKETLGVLESRNVEYKRQLAAEALACEAAGPVALTPVGEAVQKLIPEGGWAAPRQPFLVGPTSVDSHATRTCHALAAILECLPPSEYATSLSASAWELLHQIGRYEDGFEMGEEGDNARVEIDGYCSEVDKDRLLSVALKTYDTEIRPFVGLTLEEIEDIIKSNVTITDSRLYEGVYAVAVDIEAALKNKNDGSK